MAAPEDKIKTFTLPAQLPTAGPLSKINTIMNTINMTLIAKLTPEMSRSEFHSVSRTTSTIVKNSCKALFWNG